LNKYFIKAFNVFRRHITTVKFGMEKTDFLYQKDSSKQLQTNVHTAGDSIYVQSTL
jgi:hypothetical protein